MADIVQRKQEHLDIVLQAKAKMQILTGFEHIQFEHVALPEIDFDDVNISTEFLGKSLNAPLLISSMTGGPEHAERINENIATAASELGIAFGVGSQRVALENSSFKGFSSKLRALAPHIPILANFGAAQLKYWDGVSMAQKAVDMIEADALIIHLNPLQEALQAEGDKNWAGILHHIEHLAAGVDFPIIVKEVGAGLSASIAHQLYNAGVSIIDIAGAGGTSWAAVEAERAQDPLLKAVAETFRNWGIPSALALQDVRKACPKAFVIASGGIRDGLDAAKALRLGADLVGQAAGLLTCAVQSPDDIIAHFTRMIDTLKITCFCTGSIDLKTLRTAKLLHS